MPAPPPGAPGPFARSPAGKVEALLEQAGLQPAASGLVDCPFEYPDAETAWRGLSASGPYVVAVRNSGEDAVKSATLASLVPFATSEGGYRQNNKFRYVIAAVPAVESSHDERSVPAEAMVAVSQPAAVKHRWWPWRR